MLLALEKLGLPSCEVDSLRELSSGLIFTFCCISKLIKLHLASVSQQAKSGKQEVIAEVGAGTG